MKMVEQDGGLGKREDDRDRHSDIDAKADV
jgi:hypothetical protein